MWRISSEDWERKKTYLIRSLFHDIPLLSPVPEGRESSCSPCDEYWRPHSPLPPLIIEKVPDHHDEPPEYYRQLETKIRKVYRKLFLDEDSSSVDDGISADGTEIDANEKETAISEDSNNLQDYENFVVPPRIEITQDSRSDKTFIQKEHHLFDSILETPDNDEESSTDITNNDTQFTTQVTVHIPPSNTTNLEQSLEKSEHNSIYDDEDRPPSPILGPRNLLMKDAFNMKKHELLKDVRSLNVLQGVFSEESSDSELASRNEDIQEEATSDVRSSTNDANDSIEVMRRYRSVSASFGSHEDANKENLDTAINKNIGPDRNILHELNFGCESSLVYEGSEEIFLNGSFNNVSFCFSPLNRRLLQSRKRSLEHDSSDCSDFVSKRKKSRAIGVQASLIENDFECSDWDCLKNNLFVGIPKVYTLCSCRNHSCRID